MYALVVTIHIKPEHRDEFIAAMLDDARGSVQNEPGCLLFNVVQDEADPNCLHLYEVYRDAEAVQAHMQTPHFQRWLEVTKDWLAEPLAIARGTHLFPPDEVWQKQTVP